MPVRWDRVALVILLIGLAWLLLPLSVDNGLVTWRRLSAMSALARDPAGDVVGASNAELWNSDLVATHSSCGDGDEDVTIVLRVLSPCIECVEVVTDILARLHTEGRRVHLRMIGWSPDTRVVEALCRTGHSVTSHVPLDADEYRLLTGIAREPTVLVLDREYRTRCAYIGSLDPDRFAGCVGDGTVSSVRFGIGPGARGVVVAAPAAR